MSYPLAEVRLRAVLATLWALWLLRVLRTLRSLLGTALSCLGHIL